MSLLSMSYPRLYDLAQGTRERFQTATPFPHAVFDDFLEVATYNALLDSFPSPTSPIWKRPENVHTKGKLVTKRGQYDLKESFYSESARRFFMEFNSSLFLRFLETLSGISGLIPDPYFVEGGFHCSESGGFLDIHADFSHHDHLHLERRLNFLLYLNDGWKEEFGGSLTLFDRDLKPVETIAPFANRCIVFETSDASFHGYPEPLTMPNDVFRKSIALYYYSAPRTARQAKSICFPGDPSFSFSPTKD